MSKTSPDSAVVADAVLTARTGESARQDAVVARAAYPPGRLERDISALCAAGAVAVAKVVDLLGVSATTPGRGDVVAVS